MSEVEDRRVCVGELELRAVGGSDSLPRIIGYAAVFDEWSEPLEAIWGPFREKIAPGAFKTVLSGKPDVRAFREHNPDRILGRTPKTLQMEEDSRGLRVEITPPNTELGRETVELVRRRDLDSMSFTFHTPEGGADWSADGSERIVNEVAILKDVSVVSFPAYPQTVADVTRSTSDRLHDEAQRMELERMSAKWLKDSA